MASCGDFLSEGGDGGFELVGGKKMIEDAETMGGLRVNHFPEVEHFGGDGRADELRQKIGAAVIGEQADFGKILAEGGAIHGETDVAGESEIHAGAGGRAVDGGDHGLGHGADIHDGLHAGAEDGAELGGIATLAALANGAQIAAGTECAAGAGEDDDVDGRIARDADESRVESGGELVIEGVEAVGAIHHECDDRTVAGLLKNGRARSGLWSLTHGTSVSRRPA
jgi:hypothetical protein